MAASELQAGSIAAQKSGGFSFNNLFSDIRTFLYGGLNTLPLTLAGTFLLVGLMTANYAFLFFLVGFLVLVPLSQVLINNLLGLAFDYFEIPSSLFKISDHDLCNLVLPVHLFDSLSQPRGSHKNLVAVVPGLYTSMIIFFFSYLMTNAISIYRREAGERANSAKVNHRKNQMLTSAIIIGIFSILYLSIRYLYAGCDTLLGLIVALVVYIPFGVGWYKALASAGQDKLSDLFGIANRMLNVSATENQPVGCIPIRHARD
jgi:uncharacterized membrane protein